MSAANVGPVGVFYSSGNGFVQSAATNLPSPASFIGTISTQPSTAANPHANVYVSFDLYSSFQWSQFDKPGSVLAYFIEPALAG